MNLPIAHVLFSNVTYQYHYARLFCYLQAHRLLQLGGAGGAGGGAEAAREDSDSASGCSKEGSNTDSGRGPSEDGEHQRTLSPHKDNGKCPHIFKF